jgi:hypothetical protein
MWVEGVPFNGSANLLLIIHAINLSCAPAPDILKSSSPIYKGLSFSELRILYASSSSMYLYLDLTDLVI